MFRHRKACRRNKGGRATGRPRAAKMFFSGPRKDCAGAAGRVARVPEKILTARGERSERPVALPTAPARLNKPEYALAPPPGTHQAARGHGPHQRTRLPGCACASGEPRPPAGLPAAAPRARPGFAASRAPPRSACWPWAYPAP